VKAGEDAGEAGDVGEKSVKSLGDSTNSLGKAATETARQ
jgi:hypothetical protein